VGVEPGYLLEKEVVMPYNTKEKQKASSDSWYQRNKEKVKANTAKTKREYRRKWLEYKSTLACTKCGISHPAIIDFHHVIRDKEKQSVNRLIGNGAYVAAFEEIKKCIPLCANCHRILHWDEDRAKLEAKRVRKAKKAKKAKM
jgi:hypothetical protein